MKMETTQCDAATSQGMRGQWEAAGGGRDAPKSLWREQDCLHLDFRLRDSTTVRE